MSAPLTVLNAEMRTATVEIRTLTVTGKQVTLAVFRQLVEQPLIAEDGTFNGLPWGTVNYHPDKCADTREHLHVVWQSGTELRRSLVRRRQPGQTWWSEEAEHFAQASYCTGGHRKPDWASIGRDEDGERVWRFRVDGFTCYASEPTYHGDCQQGHCADASPDLPALKAAVAVEQERRDRHHARWAELLDLPQLFIAV